MPSSPEQNSNQSYLKSLNALDKVLHDSCLGLDRETPAPVGVIFAASYERLRQTTVQTQAGNTPPESELEFASFVWGISQLHPTKEKIDQLGIVEQEQIAISLLEREKARLEKVIMESMMAGTPEGSQLAKESTTRLLALDVRLRSNEPLAPISKDKSLNRR